LKKIIISRTDSIGDVILTLPMTGVLKEYFPGCHISFIGKKYTRPVIEACEHVDQFLDWDEISVSSQFTVPSSQFAAGNQHPASSIQHPASSIQHPASSIQHLKTIGADVIIHAFPVKEICRMAKKAGIPLRIATSHRWFTWLYCNKLLHFSRKNSDLHEAQLNLKLLKPLGITRSFSLEEIPGYYGLTNFPPYSEVDNRQSAVRIRHPVSSIQHPASSNLYQEDNRFKLILHPKSKGSAREWGLDNYSRLIGLLPEDKFRIFITGTREEGLLMEDFLAQHKNRVTDLTGKLTLSELIGLIDHCDGIVAASTGPLHIAAALGKHAIGLYAPMKPIFPKRWAPLGVNADYLVLDKECSDCRRSMDCQCIRSIKPEDVAGKLETTLKCFQSK
jgi:ADP-heptose:LPS heptosyltransferase